MKTPRRFARLFPMLGLLLLPCRLPAGISCELLTKGTVQAGQCAEWRLDGIAPAANNFDPDLIRVDGRFTTPSGAAITVPAFWYQGYTRALVNGVQVLAPAGEPQWRLRFTPAGAGSYALAIEVERAATDPAAVSPAFQTMAKLDQPLRVQPAPAATATGAPRVAADHHSFETSDGRPLRLIGANVCWAGPRGSYDFDAWFPAWHAAGANYARLWLSPWDLGLEQKPATLNRYDQAAAWELDHVMALAEQHGIYVLLAMDHHGMFMASDPAWGGSNNFWTRSSPYALENGGPCANPNEFFTMPEARKLYQKRLRYLIGRYGWSPRLLSWQFFNEIDNSYLPRSALVGADVVAWHREMGRWLRANDPYHHLVSTSLTGASDRPEFWTLPEMDFAVYHSYGEADPARHVAQRAADMTRRYGKPVMIGEFGTDFRQWAIANDPYLRGFRQGLWGGVLGGSVGTAMSWWWEGIHEDRAYPLYSAIRDIMRRAGWDQPGWTPAAFADAGPPPAELGEPLPDGEPFSATLPLNQLRLNPVSGEVALANPLAAVRAAERISSYLHGTKNPQFQQHARVAVWLADRARLLVRVNSVAADADLVVRVDGAEKFRVALPNKDGLAVLNDEINQEFTVDLPSGKHLIEIAHTGTDWVNLKSLRIERMRPAAFAPEWQFAADAIGLRRAGVAVVYVRSPHVAWPAGALRYNPPAVHGAKVTLKDWPAAGRVTWLDPRNGGELAHADLPAGGGDAVLAVPDFNDDLVALVEAARP